MIQINLQYWVKSINHKLLERKQSKLYYQMKFLIKILAFNLFFTNGYAQNISFKWVKKEALFYDDIAPFKKGLALTTLNNKEGLINKLGEEVCPPKYDKIQFAYQNYDGIEIMDSSSNKKIHLIVPTESEYTILVESDNKWVFIDNIGREIIPLKYESIMGLSEGLIPFD